MNSPVISVIMPVFNGGRYLAAAVTSVLAQTFADFEIIAVDDGSTDASLTILRSLAAKDARIRTLSRPNTGIVGALNDGIAAARGSLIARMDSDDLCLPQRFDIQVAYLDAHPECVLAGSQVLRVDPSGLPIGLDTEPLDHETILSRLLAGSAGSITHPSIMMRRNAVEAVGGYRPEYQWVEDYDLYLRLAEKGRLANLPDTLLHYRLHYDSVNMKRREQQGKLACECLREACQRMGIAEREPVALLRWMERPLDHSSIRSSWARRALACGNFQTARTHSACNLLSRPFSKVMWRVLVLAILKRQSLSKYSASCRHEGIPSEVGRAEVAP